MTAIRADKAEHEEERREMEKKGYVYCERHVNDHSKAYWFEPKEWQIHR